MKASIKTYYNLGLKNLIRVAYYRFSIKTRFVTKKMAVGVPIRGPFFLPPSSSVKKCKSPNNQNFAEIVAFGWLKLNINGIPNWHKSLIDGKSHPLHLEHWSAIPDFVKGVGDIKAIWECSRFDWVVIFALNYFKTRDIFWLEKLNEWLEDWSAKNPANVGPNWKCGQEASIRIIHLALASKLLNQLKQPSRPLLTLIKEHLERISPTIRYAIAQDNNHGTSEASALFIGGSWILAHDKNRQAKKWCRLGRYWMENRARRLIKQDGSFSQYSVNYHRLMLDSMTIAELWRDWVSQPKFSKLFYKKIQMSVHWLRSMVISENGDAPNLGANDGARIIPLSFTDYRDYRPSVQLAAAVFFDKRAYQTDGSYDEPGDMLAISAKETCPKLKSQLFDFGGYLVLRETNVNLFMRYPRFYFRPSHCDALHLDFWIDGINLLRDSGTYSYNTEHKWLNYFSGTVSHNTIQFDNRDQMPRISRFLFSEWLVASTNAQITRKENNSQQFEVGYKDWRGAKHTRKVELNVSNLFVTDIISGFKKLAVLRWRLMPGKWVMTDNGVELDGISLEVTASTKIKRLELVEGWESRYYMKKTKLPVLEVEVNCASIITTSLSW